MIYTTQNWQRPTLSDNADISRRVADLLRAIETDGDAAITAAAEKFDGFAPEIITLQPFDSYGLTPELAAAIRTAAHRIERFARAQRAAFTDIEFEDEYGRYGHRAVPLERIAAYIPGGRFPLISTALMTLIPARVAGVAERVALSPSVNPALLAAASLAGATRFVRIGGAQAIAAAAFGSQWSPAVDMIVGPGNAYVAEAKAQLQTRVRIDTVAGPSEVLILADGNAPIRWLIEDAIAQSEHGPDALAVIVASDSEWLNCAEQALLANTDGAALFARQQIQLVLAPDSNDAAAFSNRFAPEHLMLCDASISPNQLNHYGALFIGARSPVALGDYLSGPNHTLPTAGAARRSSGLSVLDFLRVQTVQTIEKGLPLYQAAAVLADAEGLVHHAESLRLRTTVE
ncbi:MAG TPA: histidinol dehydrogenase [Permianibacter sp.]|nr:histidinol dehydrogenase [Permianibacter sp.]